MQTLWCLDPCRRSCKIAFCDLRFAFGVCAVALPFDVLPPLCLLASVWLCHFISIQAVAWGSHAGRNSRAW